MTQVWQSYTESTCRVLTGTVQELFVTSSVWCLTHSATSFVRIESRSIAPSAKRCTFPKARIDLMERTLVLHWPTFSSRRTRRTLYSHPKCSTTNQRFLASKSQENVVQSTLTQREEQSPTLTSGSNDSKLRCTQANAKKALTPSKARQQLSKLLATRVSSGRVRAGIVGARIE